MRRRRRGDQDRFAAGGHGSHARESGFSLGAPIIVGSVEEEYQHLSLMCCPACGGGFNRDSMVRLSSVIYKGRMHDVFRCACLGCGAPSDIFFDYTDTQPQERVRLAFPLMIDLYGEVTDPIPNDIFAWSREERARRRTHRNRDAT
jgi:hypothetical protein